jgi:hypothetical protein
MRRVFAIAVAMLVGGCPAPKDTLQDGGALAATVDLPGGSGGIHFDDLRFSTNLRRILAPGAGTGNVYLVDPDTLTVVTIGGFSSGDSLDEGRGLVFVLDRSAGKLLAVDPSAKSIVASVTANGDYVRYVPPTNEVWLTQPGSGQIEVFTVPSTGTPTPAHAAFIPVAGGPEGLAIDAVNMRAYAHLYASALVAIDLASRTIVGTWPTGCSGSHGIPNFDAQRGFAFAGCSNAAQVTVFDAAHGGNLLGSYKLGGGETILAYSPTLHHFYLRGDPGSPLAILAIPANGMPSLLETESAEPNGHGGAADDRVFVWIPDAQRGRLLRFQDKFPATL